jgi:hypothetical protein
MLKICEENLIDDHHLQYVHEGQNQLNVLVNNVLMAVPNRMKNVKR